MSVSRPRSPLPWDRRVAVWDAAMSAARDVLRRGGLREVSTPCRVDAPAIEPYIEPIPAGDMWLATSPELTMKRLLCRGSGPIFQLSHVFRRGERGDRHSEEFHLLEWYRLGADMRVIEADVEAVVAAVFAAVDGASRAPKSWRRIGFLDVFAETTGVALRGDEDADELASAIASDAALHGMVFARDASGPTTARDPEVRSFASWLAVYGAWSDRLDEWLAGQGGVHIVDYPAPLAALAQCERVDGRSIAHRVESYVGAVELANGYRELRDGREQRRRFTLVNGLRVACERPPLPLDEAFLADVSSLPACSGVALGLDRLIMLACGGSSIGEISLVPPPL